MCGGKGLSVVCGAGGLEAFKDLCLLSCRGSVHGKVCKEPRLKNGHYCLQTSFIYTRVTRLYSQSFAV